MLRSFLITGVFLLATSSVAGACGGINLSWDDCGSFGGDRLRTFECNTNVGVQPMVGSFVAPSGVDSLIAIEAVIDLCTEGHPLPEWWKYLNPGTCRQSSLAASVDFTTGPANCADFWAGRGARIFVDYQIGNQGWDSARILLLVVVDRSDAGSVTPGVEYYAFKVLIDSDRTVGSPSCAGCDISACIVLNSIKLVQAGGAGSFFMASPASSYMLNWQSKILDCPFVVPARNRTWGAVKTLYR